MCEHSCAKLVNDELLIFHTNTSLFEMHFLTKPKQKRCSKLMRLSYGLKNKFEYLQTEIFVGVQGMTWASSILWF
jgi:hypothetical protein